MLGGPRIKIFGMMKDKHPNITGKKFQISNFISILTNPYSYSDISVQLSFASPVLPLVPARDVGQAVRWLKLYYMVYIVGNYNHKVLSELGQEKKNS